MICIDALCVEIVGMLKFEAGWYIVFGFWILNFFVFKNIAYNMKVYKHAYELPIYLKATLSSHGSHHDHEMN